MHWTDPAVMTALRAAVVQAIRAVGVDAFRQTSMFASSQRRAAAGKSAA